MNRKGVGYTIEAILALMTLFIFALGNTPSEPVQNWDGFQKKIEGKDMGYTLKKTGDLNDFVKRRDTGSLKTAVQSISEGQLQVSGTINNIPIREVRAAVHAKESDVFNSISLRDRQTCSGDLEEIETTETILETENYDSPRIYVADTDPEISGGNDDTLDYDTIFVDRNEKCQFSEAEGPIYMDEMFGWSGGPSPEYFEFKDVINSNNDLVVYDAEKAFRLHRTMENNKINGIETEQSFTTLKFSEEDLSNYNLLIFTEKESLEDIRQNREIFDNFASRNPVILMMDLNPDDFSKDNPNDLIPETGMEWIDMSYRVNPDGGVGFSDGPDSREIQTYFNGMGGSESDVGIDSGGKVSSSRSDTVVDRTKFVRAERGIYKSGEWNATDRSMTQIDPSTVDGEPDSACIEDGEVDSNLTKGEFEFPKYPGHEEGTTITYDVINTELGSNKQYCKEREVRALNIDLNDNGNYSDEGEGPFLNGEVLKIQNKSYKIFFPDTGSFSDGESAEFVFNSGSRVEKINMRTSLRDKGIDQLARVPYSSDYNEDDLKLISSLIHNMVGDTKSIEARSEPEASTNVYGGLTGETYIPYKASLRWR